MHAVIAPAIEELCAAFERHDYNPTPVIDIGVLVANADGTVDEQERALLSDVFQTLLETNLTPELVDALIRASAEVIQAAGGAAGPAGGRHLARLRRGGARAARGAGDCLFQ